MKKRLTHIRPLDAAKISGALGALYSLFVTVIFFFSVGVGMVTGNYHMSPHTDVGPDALLVLIAVPVVGFVYGAIAAVVFNFVAKVTGGVEFTVQDAPPPGPPPEWPSALPRYPFAPR
jgi:hypothetical protein